VRIGIMLRHIDQHGGGVLVYTRNLIPPLLALGNRHEFFLLYQNFDARGMLSFPGNTRELVVAMRSRLLWDQIAVPREERKCNFDVLFNPKYSVPLVARCPTVFVCHGLDWYIEPQWSKLSDRINHSYLIPRYARKAHSIIAVSETVRKHVLKYLKVDSARVHTVYHGVSERFTEPVPQERLEQVSRDYDLPSRFFLYVGQMYPPKNFGRLVRAYAQVGPQLGIHLVVAGEHRWLSERELALLEKLDVSRWVVVTGWIEHETLPALYMLAEALVLPSLYEAFGMPILEAMASGCPVVTADRYGTREVAGDAAVLVDPEDVCDIAAGMRLVVADQALRERVIAAGRERAREFSWHKCARETLRILESAAAGSGPTIHRSG
jgi:glycosyltransferase involved in cell wall biosynthesis